MTLQRRGGAAEFSESAADYAATMAPALWPVAQEVVRRAHLRAGERVLDIGTGTGSGAALALGEQRKVTGVDAAPGMLAIARREIPDVTFIEADFTALPMESGSFDVVLAVHALLFAADRGATLSEWRRVTEPGGRLSLSVPGPSTHVPTSVFGRVYDRYGIAWGDDYPDEQQLAVWAVQGGWGAVETEADSSASIPLADEDAFRAWLRVGARGRATREWSTEQREQFVLDLMDAAPRVAGGAFRLPFGALFLTARHTPEDMPPGD
jgi:SAM-dependent methyltransferase